MLYDICVIIIIAVTGLCFFQNRFYSIPAFKVLIMVFVMAAAGIVGMKLLHFLENGQFHGTSFFGSVFLVPSALYLIAKPMKVPQEILLDFSGPVFGLFLAIVKLNCMRLLCCSGYIMYYISENVYVRFPSAMVESFCGLVICVILLLMQQNPKNRGCLYPAFLAIYGVCRFVLNFFRADLETFRLLRWTGLTIPPGHLWSVICMIWGFRWLYRFRSRACGHKLTFKEFTATKFGLRPPKASEGSLAEDK